MHITIRPMYLMIASMAISAVLVLLSAGTAVRNEKTQAAARSAVQKVEPVGFILRAYEGKAALFRGEAERPFRVLSTELWMLPEADRAALENGIFLEDEAALRKLLEDWESLE